MHQACRSADHDLANRPGEHMLRRHLAGRGIRDPRVLAAMAKVPRERFVERASSATRPMPTRPWASPAARRSASPTSSA